MPTDQHGGIDFEACFAVIGIESHNLSDAIEIHDKRPVISSFS